MNQTCRSFSLLPGGRSLTWLTPGVAVLLFGLVVAASAQAPPGVGPQPGPPGPAPRPPAASRGVHAAPSGRKPRKPHTGSRSGAAAAKAAKATAAPEKPKEPAVHVAIGDQGVSLFCVSADADEVFTKLGRETGTRIIVDDTVDRRLTVNLTNKTVEEIINEIVATYGLSSAQVNGIYMISEGIPRGPSSYLVSDIDAIRTKYILASSAKNLLPLFLQEHVQVNPEQNAVVLSGPKPVLEKFRQDIAQFDIPAKQIMLAILVVEFTDTGRRELDSRLGWANDGLGAATKAVADTADPGQLIFHGSKVLPKEFYATLTALVSEGKARVRANPSIATLSGNKAHIFIGIQRFLQTPVERAGRGRESMNFVDAGVNLELRPLTAGGGEILIDVEEEVSTLGAPDPVTHLPDKTIRRAVTNVRVRDGETVIIGGLVQSEERDSRRKIPLLGDLPLVGKLFQNRHLERTNTELVIFITPRVLSQTGHLPAEQEQAIRRRFLLSEPGDGEPTKP